MDEEGNKWEVDPVMLMSTIIIDKDRAGRGYLQKKRPDRTNKSKPGLFSSYVRKAKPCEGSLDLPNKCKSGLGARVAGYFSGVLPGGAGALLEYCFSHSVI
jgi:hypothetical protein